MNIQSNQVKIPFFVHAVFWTGIMFVLAGLSSEYALHHVMSVPSIIFGAVLIIGSALTANQYVKNTEEDT